jgi:hypothetical protein
MTKRIVSGMDKLVLFANAIVSSPETMVSVAQMILSGVGKSGSFRSCFYFMNKKKVSWTSIAEDFNVNNGCPWVPLDHDLS